MDTLNEELTLDPSKQMQLLNKCKGITIKKALYLIEVAEFHIGLRKLRWEILIEKHKNIVKQRS